METIVGTNTNAYNEATGQFDATESFKFRVSQFYDLGLHYGDYSLQEIADILASNVEVPTVEADGTVDVSNPSNFNDSYDDMVADLCGEDDEDEDDEDEDEDDEDED